MSEYLVQFNNISKFFGKVIALKDVTMKLKKGEIMCLLGDNGAGKSTLIKTLAGVHKPDEGEIIFEDKKIIFDSPRDALDIGIGTVYQDLALVSLMSVTRNFLWEENLKKVYHSLKHLILKKLIKLLQKEWVKLVLMLEILLKQLGQCLAVKDNAWQFQEQYILAQKF